MVYHINPSTGRAGECKAMISCPYGDLETAHYGTKDEARAAYEAIMKKEEVAVAAKKRSREKVTKELSEAQSALDSHTRALKDAKTKASDAFMDYDIDAAEEARALAERFKRELSSKKARVTKLRKELQNMTPPTPDPQPNYGGCGGGFGRC